MLIVTLHTNTIDMIQRTTYSIREFVIVVSRIGFNMAFLLCTERMTAIRNNNRLNKNTKIK